MARIERLGEDDWERARAIRLRALRDAPDAFGSTLAAEEHQSPEWWRERLARADAATFVAGLGDDDLGLVVGARCRGREGAAGLFSMWVAPVARGRGLGDALVEAVVLWARREGYPRILLDVADGNPAAIRLYARHGFEPTGVRGSLPPPREHILEHERALAL